MAEHRWMDDAGDVWMAKTSTAFGPKVFGNALSTDLDCADAAAAELLRLSSLVERLTGALEACAAHIEADVTDSPLAQQVSAALEAARGER